MTTLNDSGGLYEAEIRELIEDRAKAIRAKDVEGAIGSLAPGVLDFDLINPLQSVGSSAIKKRLEDWFASFQGPIGYEVHDLIIAAADGVAYSHSLNKVTGTSNGSELATIGSWLTCTARCLLT